MKKAFTLIELVIVIVVIGIIAGFAIPRIGKSDSIQAVDQIISNIRYSQHLALIDDKFDPTNANYFQQNWRVIFYKVDKRWLYKVASRDQKNNVISAKDPLNPTKDLEVDLTDKFKVSNINLTNADPLVDLQSSIIFNDLGSPVYETNKANKLVSSTTLNIIRGKDCISIIIEPITGYTHILKDSGGNIVNCSP